MPKKKIPYFLLLLWSVTMYCEANDLSGISLKSIDGDDIHLGDVIGKRPVYLKFWASWCMPCREQMPHLQHSFETYGKQIVILAINLNINDNLTEIRKIQHEFGLTLPIIQDVGAMLSQTFDLKATPYHVLLNRQGKIIHVGHDISEALNKKLASLANSVSQSYDEVIVENQIDTSHPTLIDKHKPTILFFASAWCDWYLKDLRPEMSAQCIKAQNEVNALAKQFPNLLWQGILTRLWTGEKDMNEYIEKYQIPFHVSIDNTNGLFYKYKVDKFPTLIAFRNGTEVYRTHSFSNSKQLASTLAQLASMP